MEIEQLYQQCQRCKYLDMKHYKNMKHSRYGCNRHICNEDNDFKCFRPRIKANIIRHIQYYEAGTMLKPGDKVYIDYDTGTAYKRDPSSKTHDGIVAFYLKDVYIKGDIVKIELKPLEPEKDHVQKIHETCKKCIFLNEDHAKQYDSPYAVHGCDQASCCKSNNFKLFKPKEVKRRNCKKCKHRHTGTNNYCGESKLKNAPIDTFGECKSFYPQTIGEEPRKTIEKNCLKCEDKYLKNTTYDKCKTCKKPYDGYCNGCDHVYDHDGVILCDKKFDPRTTVQCTFHTNNYQTCCVCDKMAEIKTLTFNEKCKKFYCKDCIPVEKTMFPDYMPYVMDLNDFQKNKKGLLDSLYDLQAKQLKERGKQYQKIHEEVTKKMSECDVDMSRDIYGGSEKPKRPKKPKKPETLEEIEKRIKEKVGKRKDFLYGLYKYRKDKDIYEKHTCYPSETKYKRITKKCKEFFNLSKEEAKWLRIYKYAWKGDKHKKKFIHEDGKKWNTLMNKFSNTNMEAFKAKMEEYLIKEKMDLLCKIAPCYKDEKQKKIRKKIALKICESCGAEVILEAKFCSECGEQW